MKLEISEKNQADAKEIVDFIFNHGLFNEKVTRDDMNCVEDSIAFHFQSNIDSYIMGQEFLEKIDKEKFL